MSESSQNVSNIFNPTSFPMNNEAKCVFEKTDQWYVNSFFVGLCGVGLVTEWGDNVLFVSLEVIMTQ